MVPHDEPEAGGTQRGILVFCIWSTLGFLGLAFWLEGLARDALVPSCIGIALTVAAFVAHIVLNAVFRRGFSRGEAALAIGLYGLLALLYVGARLLGGLGQAGAWSGLALLGVLAAGFIVYLATRFGVRGAFSRFHPAGPGAQRPRR